MLLTAVLVLEITGLLILYSASAYNGQVRFADEGYYLKKQLFFANRRSIMEMSCGERKRSTC